MLKLPYLQEVRFYMLAVDIDLCVAGNLKDPSNGLHIKKALTIMSTSRNMINALSGLKCHGNHQHQVIEGQEVPRSIYQQICFHRELSQKICPKDCHHPGKGS